MRLVTTGLVAAAALATASPALAQKSKDTIRLGLSDSISTLSTYHYPVAEAGNFYRGVYEPIIGFDERKQKFVPMLAKSWTRKNVTVLEFDLRDDIKFHNGDKFDADDVIHTLKYLKDPKTNIRFKGRYTWWKSVEKLGPYKIRIDTGKPNAMDMSTLAYRIRILNAESHKSLADPATYGRDTPYGTGPYKVVSLDKAGGIMVERYEDYNTNKEYMRAPIKRVHGVPIPDRQTQVAEFLTGGLDLLRDTTPDMAKNLKQSPNVTVTAVRTGSFVYFGLDAVGRGPNKALKDLRVRKAIYMAMDRDAIIKAFVPGAEVAEKLQGLCFSTNTGCKFTNKFPDYNPKEAKRLLAEAGYPNGFDLHYDVYAPIKEIGEAIAGELRKVGIRTSVQPQTIGAWRRKQGRSELEAWSVYYPTSGHPDVGNILNVFFAASRDYAKDPIIHKAMEEGLREFDPEKRASIYQRALERNNEMLYMLAFSSLPMSYIHTNDVKIGEDLLSANEVYITDYMWK